MPNDGQGTFGRRLALIRQDRDLSQHELGTAVGRTRQTIAAWETKNRLHLRHKDRLARALGCSIDELMAPLDAPIPPPSIAWTRKHAPSTMWARKQARRQRKKLKKTSPDRTSAKWVAEAFKKCEAAPARIEQPNA